MKSISLKLGVWIIFLFILMIAILGGIIYFFFINFYLNHVTNELLHRGHSHAEVLGKNFTEDTLKHVALMEKAAITSVVVLDNQGNILVSSEPIEDFQQPYLRPAKNMAPLWEEIAVEKDWRKKPYIVTRSPILKDGQLLGTVIMFAPTQPIREGVQVIQWMLMITVLGAVLVSSGLVVLFSRKITKPLIHMKQVTQEIAKGNYHLTVPVNGKDEIADLARAINALSKALERYESSRNEFLSNISHELRTPMMYIKGYADLLKKGRVQDDDQQKKYLNIISEETERVQHLVKDLFELTKMREGIISLHWQKVDLPILLKSVIEKARMRIEQKGITLEFYAEPAAIEAEVDPDRIEQVMMNLLENARTYTPEGGSINVNVSKRGSFIVVEVRDTGIGIPEQDLQLIWERFYRVEKSRSRDHGGSGLGLAITKQIVELHGGYVEAESEPGKGSCFRFILPIMQKGDH